MPLVEDVLKRALEARLLISLDVKAPAPADQASLAGIPFISDLGRHAYAPLVERIVDFFRRWPELYDYAAVCSFDCDGHLLD